MSGQYSRRRKRDTASQWSDGSDSESEKDQVQSEKSQELENTIKKQKTDGDRENASFKDDNEITISNSVGIRKNENSENKEESLKDDIDDTTEDHDLGELRTLARRKYLSQREQKKLELLKFEVSDMEKEIEEVGWENYTENEKDEYKLKKEILDSIIERQSLQNEEGYQLPQDYLTSEGKIDIKRKEESLYKKYQNDDSKKDWISEQMDKANKINRSEKLSITKQRPTEKGKDGQSTKHDYNSFVFAKSQMVDFVLDSKTEELLKEEEKQRNIEQLIEEEKQKIKSIDETRKSLPVYKFREQLIDAITEHQILIVVGETGSGKTTQLPQYLHESGFTKDGKIVGCTQPRRVAAMSVATRVAEEVGCRLGKEVGYTIRFEDKTSNETVIKYMTDGMLLREFLNDPELANYSALMIDEAHERTLQTDIVLALLKEIIKERKDLKLLISSATMNAQKFSDYFDGAPIFNIPGRRFPVEIHYTLQPESDYINAAMTTIFQIHLSQGTGDILVFLTGQEEIDNLYDNLQDMCRKLGSSIKEMIVCSIYANLPSELQQKIFEPTPPNARKVILATNIAETSLTINGIVYVIDSGFVKETLYNPSTGVESLEVVPCSRASADQRAGRAGRVGPGKCFRLYTKWAYQHEMQGNPTPEILRTNLSSVVLLLLSLGINDLLAINFLDSPSTDALMKSLDLLYSLGALNENGQLTSIGYNMSEFPINPMISKSLLSSGDLKCCGEVLSIVSMLDESSALFFRPKDKKAFADKAKDNFANKTGGDHLTLLNIWDEWVESGFSNQWCKDNFIQYKTLVRVRNVRDQLGLICKRLGLLLDDPSNSGTATDKRIKQIKIQKAITSGFFSNAARLNKSGDSYKSLEKNNQVFIHPSSVIFPVRPPPKLVIFHELVMTSKEYMRNCMPIEEKWLSELANHYYSEKSIKK
ncbi:nucleic acid binding protein [[Candida] boidinii]|nr:nucleic acid binding protein [[Candida] boidinii]